MDKLSGLKLEPIHKPFDLNLQPIRLLSIEEECLGSSGCTHRCQIIDEISMRRTTDYSFQKIQELLKSNSGFKISENLQRHFDHKKRVSQIPAQEPAARRTAGCCPWW